MNIFRLERNEKSVLVISVTGCYHCQLLSPNDIQNKPSRKLAVDTEHQLLYVEQERGAVWMFKLTYDNEVNI